MGKSLDLSYKFSVVVKKLHQEPDNPQLKQEMLRHLPAMKVLARDNPVALYRLAQSYAPTTPQYQHMLRQSANMGCTNAMLDLCKVLLKSDCNANLHTAVHYVQMIKRSKDSYMMKQSQQLLEAYPELAIALKSGVNPDRFSPNIRFFTVRSELVGKKTLDVDSCIAGNSRR